jgi:hypothetical protein
MFNTIRISLICEACRLAGNMDCPHNKHEIPPWKRDQKRARLVEGVMQSDVALHMRENAGVVQKQNNTAFNVSNVESLLLSQHDNTKHEHVENIFVCIDTAGGGSSCTAMCCGYFTKNYSLVILGASSVVGRSNRNVCRYHFRDKNEHGWIFCVQTAFQNPRFP